MSNDNKYYCGDRFKVWYGPEDHQYSVYLLCSFTLWDQDNIYYISLMNIKSGYRWNDATIVSTTEEGICIIKFRSVFNLGDTYFEKIEAP